MPPMDCRTAPIRAPDVTEHVTGERCGDVRNADDIRMVIGYRASLAAGRSWRANARIFGARAQANCMAACSMTASLSR